MQPCSLQNFPAVPTRNDIKLLLDQIIINGNHKLCHKPEHKLKIIRCYCVQSVNKFSTKPRLMHLFN